VVESAAALIFVGVGLNFLVMQTLGSFDVASVILALFLGFWALVLGNTVVFFSSIWLFLKRRDLSAKPAGGQPEAPEHRLIGQRTEPCHAC
jgi:hypothetical protein